MPYKKIYILLLTAVFLAHVLFPSSLAFAGMALDLPKPGQMVLRSPDFQPLLLKGLQINSQDPFQFNFLMDPGEESIHDPEPLLKEKANRLVKYFLACLAIPEEDVWVNLSPYEHNRMIPVSLGRTELGWDLLAQDYVLKQLTASMIYPEGDVGKKFWQRVYALAKERFGTTEIPVNTFNKVWVLADQARVYESNKGAYVLSAHMKIMLDEDYVARQEQPCKDGPCARRDSGVITKGDSSIGSQIMREVVIPEIEHEVNVGKNFAQLRQMYHAFVLASWYKKKLKQSLFNQVYADQNKVAGLIASEEGHQNPQAIYEQYLAAYKKGVFNYIASPEAAGFSTTGELGQDTTHMPRKYFSGGTRFKSDSTVFLTDKAILSEKEQQEVGKEILSVGVEMTPDLDVPTTEIMPEWERQERLAVAVRSLKHGSEFFGNWGGIFLSERLNYLMSNTPGKNVYKVFKVLSEKLMPISSKIEEIYNLANATSDKYEQVYDKLKELLILLDQYEHDKKPLILEFNILLEEMSTHPLIVERTNNYNQFMEDFRRRVESRVAMVDPSLSNEDFSLSEFIKILDRPLTKFGSMKQFDMLTMDIQAPTEIRIRGNKYLLASALCNIVYNGIDATPVEIKNRVNVQFIVKDGFLEVYVIDKGSGIPSVPKDLLAYNPKTQRKVIFDLGVSLNKKRGTGLGATEAFYALKNLGGSIDARNRSKDEGGGAEFILRVPIVSNPSPDHAMAAQVRFHESFFHQAVVARSSLQQSPGGVAFNTNDLKIDVESSSNEDFRDPWANNNSQQGSMRHLKGISPHIVSLRDNATVLEMIQ